MQRWRRCHERNRREFENIDAQQSVRGDGRKRASLACGAFVALLLARLSTGALGTSGIAPALGDTICHMIDWSTCQAVERDPQRVSGAWVFRGSRVPVSALFENLEDGGSVDQFVEWFPGVALAQVRAVLEHAARSALAPA